MKIKIAENGWLNIERAGTFKKASCPYSRNSEGDNPASCGDWCALFGEPETLSGINKTMARLTKPTIILKICKKDFVIEKENFTDERKS